MTIRVKMMITIDVDTEEYAVPTDGKIDEEIEDYLKESLHDLHGTSVRNFRITSEEIHI